MAENQKIRVGITHGDTNGIGYEVILKTLSNPLLVEICTPVLYGSTKIATYHRKALDMPGINFNVVQDAAGVKDDVNNFVDVIKEEVKVDIGQPSKAAGEAAFVVLERAVADLKDGKIDVLVTAPINKNTIQCEEFRFPGHTEYLEESAGDGSKSLMILYNDRVKVALVTTHLPLSEVATAITKDSVLSKIKQFNDSLKQDFAIVHPRIAVLGLNPHSGDNGLLGKEEQMAIIPAIDEANDCKISCFGPYAADGFFGSGQYEHFDGVLAMYHDQGLTPLKTLGMENGVNYTAGLPFVRTSPDHGTGYDIAGKNLADESSLREAIYQAIDIYRNRMIYDDITSNPLRRQYVNKGADNVVLDLTKVDDEH